MLSKLKAWKQFTNYGYPAPHRVGDHVMVEYGIWAEVVPIPRPRKDGRAGSIFDPDQRDPEAGYRPCKLANVNRLMGYRYPSIPLPDSDQRRPESTENSQAS